MRSLCRLETRMRYSLFLQLLQLPIFLLLLPVQLFLAVTHLLLELFDHLHNT